MLLRNGSGSPSVKSVKRVNCSVVSTANDFFLTHHAVTRYATVGFRDFLKNIACRKVLRMNTLWTKSDGGGNYEKENVATTGWEWSHIGSYYDASANASRFRCP